MEDKSCHPIPINEDTVGIVRSLRDLPPAHYKLKIEKFSLLLDTQVEKYESTEFEAGGYKWSLILYPKGNNKRNGNGHLSLYLTISKSNSLPGGWEINVNYKLFVFDQIRDKYLTIQDGNGRVSRFHDMKTELGFTQLLPLDTFKDSSNGYLVDDCCVFGVEVFVIKGTGNGECLSMINEPKNGLLTWKIDKFSALDQTFHSSQVFTVEGVKWNLMLYPKGDQEKSTKSLSLYLILDASETLSPKRKLYVKFILRIRDQIHSKHRERTADVWFCTPGAGGGYDFSEFLALNDVNDTSKGFLVNDCLIIEGKLLVLSVIKDF